MMNQMEFELWCKKAALTEAGKAFVTQIRSSNPARRVASGAANVSGRYCSTKMGVTIQFESHCVELPRILELEREKDVLEYYDQPTQIKLNYRSPRGRSVATLYTPDFFVMHTDCAGFEECKTEEELLKLEEKNPERYYKDEQEQWRCPPGEEFAKKYGLYFAVRSAKEINWIYQRNLNFLDDYFRERHEVIDVARMEICSMVRVEEGLSLAKLIQQRKNFLADDVNALIASEELYVNLQTQLLKNAESVAVYSQVEAAKLAEVREQGCMLAERAESGSFINVENGEILEWDGFEWLVLNAGLSVVTLQSENGKIMPIAITDIRTLIQSGQIKAKKTADSSSLSVELQKMITEASSEAMAVAAARCKIVEKFLKGEKNEIETSERTVRRWVLSYRQALERWNCGYVGLLPKTSKRGNRMQKLPEPVEQLILDVIEQEYETKQQKTKYNVYSGLVDKCLKNGVITPSYKTFIKTVNNRPRYEQTLKRQGRRAAYVHEQFYMELDTKTPRHGDRPFEVCHIDHTELDIELISSRNGKNYGRPWATFLVDAYSRRLLSVYLTYDPPSYRSCMMTIRECVRRHARLPQTIVVDGGKEFQGIYFETLLARFEVTKKTRPPAKARFGSVCERLFGTANTTFVHNLIGNTKITRNVRQVTKSVNPKGLAVWTIGVLYERLCEWAYEFYDTKEHPALGQSPREEFEAALLASGQRYNRMIPYNEEFRIYTLPTTTKGTAKIDPERGVKIKYIYYWSDVFRDPEVERKLVHIRYDPFDAGIAYAFVKGQWVSCTSEYYALFQGRTEKEIQMVTEEIRKQKNVHGKNFTIHAANIAKQLAPIEKQEAQLMQNKKDLESKQVLEIIEGGLNKKTIEESKAVTKNSEPCVRAIKKLEIYEEY